MTNEKDKSRLREILLAHSEGSELVAALDNLLATVRGEEREAAFRDVKRVIAEAAAKCPVFIFHSKQGKEFLMNALETASTENRKGEG